MRDALARLTAHLATDAGLVDLATHAARIAVLRLEARGEHRIDALMTVADALQTIARGLEQEAQRLNAPPHIKQAYDLPREDWQ